MVSQGPPGADALCFVGHLVPGDAVVWGPAQGGGLWVAELAALAVSMTFTLMRMETA